MGRFSKLETHGPPTPPPGSVPAVPGGFGVRRSLSKQPAALAPSPEYDSRYYQAEGDRYYYTGEYEKALRMYSRGVQAEKTYIDPWIGQIRCLLEMRQNKEAMVWAKRTIELFPEDPRTLSLQGMAYAACGMVERGLACSDYAIGRAGQPADDPFVWAARGSILSLGENRNAEHCFDKAMTTRQRDDWRTPLSLGLLMLSRKKWAKAIEFFEAAVAACQSNDFLWERLGWARERLGLAHAALEAYEAALHLNPSNRAAESGQIRVQNSSVWRRLARRLFR